MNTRTELPGDLATRLIRRSARRAPAALASRLEEEWLAELHARTGTLARLRLAAGCWWARQVIARDPLWAMAPAPAAAAQGAAWILHAPSRPTRRVAVLFVIGGLHAGAALAFLYGVRHDGQPKPPPVIDGTVIHERKPVEPPAPMPHGEVTTLAHNPLPGPVPLDDIHWEEQTQPPSVGDPAKGTIDVPRAAQRVRGGPGVGFPATREFYPPASIRFGEQGVATVGVCVDARGLLTGEPSVQRSSGYPRLDAGALALARAGSGHYRSNAEDGRAVDGCFAYSVRFALGQ